MYRLQDYAASTIVGLILALLMILFLPPWLGAILIWIALAVLIIGAVIWAILAFIVACFRW